MLVIISTNIYAFRDDIVFTIGVENEQDNLKQKLRALSTYSKLKKIQIDFVKFNNYSEAEELLKSGKINGLFADSAIASIFLLKKIANPIVRALRIDGGSTYSSVIIAKKGADRFSGMPIYFNNKKIAFAGLTSAGEIYYKYLTKYSKYKAKKIVRTKSHGDALNLLINNKVDLVIIKNLVWNKVKNFTSGVEEVGGNGSLYPDNTLIVSTKYNLRKLHEINNFFLEIISDDSKIARKTKKILNILGYIETSREDFNYSINQLQRIGVNKEFVF